MHTWADLPYLLAMAERKTLAAAARALGVNHTTVLRRIAAFERRLGVRLFDRLPAGYALTAAGEQLVATAAQMQELLDSAERRLAGRDLALTGTVRLATTDTLAASILPAALARLAAAHPKILLEVTTATAMVSLTRRDADIALRPARPPAHLIGRRVGEVAFAVYAARGSRARRPAWLGVDDSLADTTIGRWMAAEQIEPILRVDTLTALAAAAAAGHGIAALPCYLGDSLRALRRFRGVIPGLATELWILTHEDLRDTARIRAVTDALYADLRARRDLLEGRATRT